MTTLAGPEVQRSKGPKVQRSKVQAPEHPAGHRILIADEPQCADL